MSTPAIQWSTPEIEACLDGLLARLTLQQKIGQLNQEHGLAAASAERLAQGGIGSLINAAGGLTGSHNSASSSAEQVNALQRLAVEGQAGVPLLFGRDVIHGYRTVFPIPLGLAASWDPALVEQASAIAAAEASAGGIRWTFAPMIDIARDARWGRIAEGAGEDPYLGSQMAAAAVRGFQGSNPANPARLLACAKHFLGYGAAEGGRDYEGGEINEPTLRDVYLPPYRAAVAAGAGSLMSAFHEIGGTPMSANRRLLTGVLRGELGFGGFVVSDWESVAELAYHGVAADAADAARIALHSGIDMDMVSGAYRNHLAELLQQGQVSLDEIEQAARRILRVKLRLGLFEQPYTDPARAAREILSEGNRLLAWRAAVMSIVLLKNEAGLLPLDGGQLKRIAVVGPLVEAQGELLGSWSPDGRAADVTPLPEALRRAAPPGVELRYARHADLAVRLAAVSAVVVAVVGEDPYRSGENNNVAALDLPAGQIELLEALADQGTPLVVVVLAGRPLALTRLTRRAQAILYAWHPGVEGWTALADVLFGNAAPGGRLPSTFPRHGGQMPLYYNHRPSGRPPTRDFMGPRYTDLPLEQPLYPFGYGLGYTRFGYTSLQAGAAGGRIQASAEVANLGAVTGEEVVQLYVRDRVASVARPVKELKGFERITLRPGERRRVQFSLGPEELAFSAADGRTVFEPGVFDVWIGPHSGGGLQATVELA